MFYYLEGAVAEILPGIAVIDCGGVGYACMTTNHTLAGLQKGKKSKLYTFFQVSENAVGLYGFSTGQELNIFKQLLAVSGVGPKAALSILSANTPEALTLAVISGDEKALTAAPGIGKKIAQRIILELKEKLSKEASQSSLDFRNQPANYGNVPVINDKAAEAAAALAVLGYSTQEAFAALKGIDTAALPLEEIVRQSLRKMVK